MRSCLTPAVYNQALSIPVKWHEVSIAVNHDINPKSDSSNADPRCEVAVTGAKVLGLRVARQVDSEDTSATWHIANA
jgi:hypothetical protein